MCLACVGSCPEAALLDHAETPQLRFIESNCVQCGLCARTCPEQAITLVPRLDLTPDARAPRVLNEAAIFACTRCGKPMGTEKLVLAMVERLRGHSMFAGEDSLARLAHVRRLPRRGLDDQREDRGHPQCVIYARSRTNENNCGHPGTSKSPEASKKRVIGKSKP